MKSYITFICAAILWMGVTTELHAQDNIIKSLERYEPGQGKVQVHQDPKITALLGNPHIASGEGVIKMPGYRVQVYAGGNTREAKRDAESYGARVRNGFPELKVYTTFNPPRWLCRVGDFLSIEEADAMMRKLRKEGGFKEVTIIKEQVNIHL